MDVSVRYIKMCEKSQEITNWKRFKYNEGDYCFIVGIGIELIKENDLEITIRNNFWLPRQDQLQEMIVKEGKTVNMLISLIHRFYCNNENDYESMEQLWLAFVMKEKYNKFWSEWRQEWITK